MSEQIINVNTNKKSKFKRLKFKASTYLVILIVLGSVSAAAVSTIKYMDLKENPDKIAQAEQKDLLSKVGKLIELPKDETPSIATVSDKEKLKDQAFFNDAKNGDTLLIYTNAKEAILYRETENKVIKVAPLAIDSTTEKK